LELWQKRQNQFFLTHYDKATTIEGNKTQDATPAGVQSLPDIPVQPPPKKPSHKQKKKGVATPSNMAVMTEHLQKLTL
jgi:hypothetical protein